MQPRILRTLVHAFLDPLKVLCRRVLQRAMATSFVLWQPLTTHYGAVMGLTALGATVVEVPSVEFLL